MRPVRPPRPASNQPDADPLPKRRLTPLISAPPPAPWSSPRLAEYSPPTDVRPVTPKTPLPAAHSCPCHTRLSCCPPAPLTNCCSSLIRAPPTASATTKHVGSLHLEQAPGFWMDGGSTADPLLTRSGCFARARQGTLHHCLLFSRTLCCKKLEASGI